MFSTLRAAKLLALPHILVGLHQLLELNIIPAKDIPA